MSSSSSEAASPAPLPSLLDSIDDENLQLAKQIVEKKPKKRKHIRSEFAPRDIPGDVVQWNQKRGVLFRNLWKDKRSSKLELRGLLFPIEVSVTTPRESFPTLVVVKADEIVRLKMRDDYFHIREQLYTKCPVLKDLARWSVITFRQAPIAEVRGAIEEYYKFLDVKCKETKATYLPEEERKKRMKEIYDASDKEGRKGLAGNRNAGKTYFKVGKAQQWAMKYFKLCCDGAVVSEQESLGAREDFEDFFPEESEEALLHCEEPDAKRVKEATEEEQAIDTIDQILSITSDDQILPQVSDPQPLTKEFLEEDLSELSVSDSLSDTVEEVAGEQESSSPVFQPTDQFTPKSVLRTISVKELHKFVKEYKRSVEAFPDATKIKLLLMQCGFAEPSDLELKKATAVFPNSNEALFKPNDLVWILDEKDVDYRIAIVRAVYEKYLMVVYVDEVEESCLEYPLAGRVVDAKNASLGSMMCGSLGKGDTLEGRTVELGPNISRRICGAYGNKETVWSLPADVFGANGSGECLKGECIGVWWENGSAMARGKGKCLVVQLDLGCTVLVRRDKVVWVD